MIDSEISQASCPICLGITGDATPEQSLIVPSDIILKTDTVVALINSFFIPGNEGHIIIVPVAHHPYVYHLPNSVADDIFRLSKHIATIMRTTYPECAGITIQQNNEPAGDQHVPHYHLHIIPRYAGDSYNAKPTTRERVPAPVGERARFAQVMKEALSKAS
jgi:histidine triad (HIT) family protein